MKPTTKVIIAISAVILILVLFIFAGGVKVSIDNNELAVSSLLVSNTKIQISEIQSIELVENLDYGKRISGLGTIKMQLGSYENDQFGEYKLYSYSQVKTVILIRTNDSIIALNQKTYEKTKQLYDDLETKVGRK